MPPNVLPRGNRLSTWSSSYLKHSSNERARSMAVTSWQKLSTAVVIKNGNSSSGWSPKKVYTTIDYSSKHENNRVSMAFATFRKSSFTIMAG
jgi:hypothetical protein